MRRPAFSHRLRLLLLFCVFLSSTPGILSSSVVTLGSIVIFNTHEWLALRPKVYFYCKGENKTLLPDVIKKDFLYVFKGKESWQPLMQFSTRKCKRCGLYEKDTIKWDDIFDEWEFCPDEFVNGEYVHAKENEFNATFTCTECISIVGSTDTTLDISQEGKKQAGDTDTTFEFSQEAEKQADDTNASADLSQEIEKQAGSTDTTLDPSQKSEKGSSQTSSGNNDGEKKLSVILVVILSTLVSIVVASITVAAYKYWQKRKREQDQARFLKLFEEGDDMDEELDL